nr:putative ribonuclease H-like domain-containing protein [Tanacetum cinerariifolium]
NPKNNKDAHTGGNKHNDDIQKSVSPSCGDPAKEQGDKAINKDNGKSLAVTITGFRDLNEEFAYCINNSSNGTRSMAIGVRDQGGISQMFNEDFHTCMFAYFLSQDEPKKIHQALKDPSWIEAMQEELLQFKMQKV